jgi:hypothetical protein
MGGNSTIIAMAKWPEEFSDIRALALLNVVSGKTFIERGAENVHGDPAKAASLLDERLRELTGFRLDEETPLPYAKHVKLPTLMAQLRRDFLIHGDSGSSNRTSGFTPTTISGSTPSDLSAGSTSTWAQSEAESDRHFLGCPSGIYFSGEAPSSVPRDRLSGQDR